ncbi:hypothetical protein HK102_007378, partial [Quaeritorhiza haematococci]
MPEWLVKDLGAKRLATNNLPVSKRTKTDTDNYESWRDVAFAIHDATKGSDSGFEIFCKFSQFCPSKYDPVKCRKMWDRWKDLDEKEEGTRKIRFGSLVNWETEDAKQDHQFHVIYPDPLELFERLQPILDGDYG